MKKVNRSEQRYFSKTMPSPVGTLRLIAVDDSLTAIVWEKDNPRRVRLSSEVVAGNHPVLAETERQLNEYFAGERKTFELKLNFAGTDFQKKVWQALMTIPYGETRSYGELAQQIGNRNAVRAVGAANGRNPIAIIAPCHRVVGATGALTGFAGGLKAKAFLLELESKQTSMLERIA